MDAYFDMFSGISGNMVLGALIDLGLDLDELNKELDKLGLSDEFNIKLKKVIKEGISGTHVEVELLEVHGHHHEHKKQDEHIHKDDCSAQKVNTYSKNKNLEINERKHRHSHGRDLNNINRIIDNSSLSENIKEKSKSIFLNLAKAEAKIHATTVDKIHFHEVGAVDAIVDIVGSVIGLELLEVKNILASRIHTGTGFVNCQHGKMPIPAPATMELLTDVPIYSTGIKSELVTPTGAAIITTLASDFLSRPEMEIVASGYGAGSRDLEIPNLLRINLGNILDQNIIVKKN